MAAAYSSNHNSSSSSNPMPETASHSENCSTVFLRSIYDKTCPRCVQINKVIQLKRRNISNGATVTESQNANKLAEILIAKFNLSRAETIDRLYQSVTNKIKLAKKSKTLSKKVVHEDAGDYMDF